MRLRIYDRREGGEEGREVCISTCSVNSSQDFVEEWLSASSLILLREKIIIIIGSETEPLPHQP